jgi:hypothetical protein
MLLMKDVKLDVHSFPYFLTPLDYILAYEPYDQDENRRINRSSKREKFEENLKEFGLELEKEDVEVGMVLLFHC